MKRAIALSFIAITLLAGPSQAGEDSHKADINHGRYIGGGIASIFAPFGIGQAIQGRYKETGWIFTVADSASLAVLTTGAIVTAAHVANNTTCTGNICKTTAPLPAAGISLYVIGAAALAGFRVWEIVDAWVTPPSEGRLASAPAKRANERLAFMPMIAPNYLGFAMQF